MPAKKTKKPRLKKSKASAPAPKAGKAQRAKKDPGEGKPKRVSALDAAAQVLARAKEPMNAKDMIAAMSEQGLWIRLCLKTP